MLIPRSNLLTNQVTSQRSKPLTKTLRDIVLIMADFVGTPLGAVVFRKPECRL